MKRLLNCLVVSLVLAGCGGTPPVPTDHYYRLPPPQAGGAAAGLAAGPIYVERLAADGVLMERPLVHTEGSDATRVLQHHYHHWVDAPPRLIRDHLIDFLRADGAAPVVSQSPDVEAELSVFGKIRRLEIIDGRGAGEVLVELEFRVDRVGADAPLLVQHYQERVPARSDSMDAAVVAFGSALSAIYARLAEDIRGRL